MQLFQRSREKQSQRDDAIIIASSEFLSFHFSDAAHARLAGQKKSGKYYRERATNHESWTLPTATLSMGYKKRLYKKPSLIWG